MISRDIQSLPAKSADAKTVKAIVKLYESFMAAKGRAPDRITLTREQYGRLVALAKKSIEGDAVPSLEYRGVPLVVIGGAP